MGTLPASTNISSTNTLSTDLSERRSFFTSKCMQPIKCYLLSSTKFCSFQQNQFKLRACEKKLSFFGESREKFGILRRDEDRRGKDKRVVLVRLNQFRFPDGDGGGGGRGGNDNTRALGNLVLAAIALTYLSMTGQLGWVLDAIVSIWLLAVILLIAGLGAFLWWASRDMVQDSCPNCGNEFQILKSSMKDGVEQCPYCSQPFSVEGNKFTRESTGNDSNRSTTFGQAFNGFSPGSKKGKASSATVVDIEAESEGCRMMPIIHAFDTKPKVVGSSNFFLKDIVTLFNGSTSISQLSPIVSQ